MDQKEFTNRFSGVIERSTRLKGLDRDISSLIGIDIDNIDFVEIVMHAEEEFGVEIGQVDEKYCPQMTYGDLHQVMYEAIKA